MTLAATGLWFKEQDTMGATSESLGVVDRCCDPASTCDSREMIWSGEYVITSVSPDMTTSQRRPRLEAVSIGDATLCTNDQ